MSASFVAQRVYRQQAEFTSPDLFSTGKDVERSNSISNSLSQALNNCFHFSIRSNQVIYLLDRMDHRRVVLAAKLSGDFGITLTREFLAKIHRHLSRN